jgi:anti-sigma factor RsiW
MNCQETREIIHAYLDSELDVVHNLAVEQHLRECAVCAQTLRAQQSLRKAMSGPSLYFKAPQGLERRVRAALRAEAKTQAPRWFSIWPRILAPLAAAAVVFLIALPLVMRTSSQDQLAQEIVSAHVRSLMANHLTDVASTDQHTVKPWFNGKLPFSPPVADLAAQGFPLTGGRLDYVQNRPVAALVYQHRKHFINLFVWPSNPNSSKGEDFHLQQGYNLIHWSQAGMEFWAVSDMNPHDLEDFAQLLRVGPSPPKTAALWRHRSRQLA